MKTWKETEKECLKKLQIKAYWAYLCPNGVGGQPCDIIAIHKNKSLLLDVKHCDNNKFELRRIEPNQWNCFLFAQDLSIECGFAIYCEHLNCWKWLSFNYAKSISKLNRKSVIVDDLEDFDNVLSGFVRV